ncbi:MAG: polyprenyl synthetase family protein [Gammaproteobacteria bacterium]|nr:polyprenyl synthetase family protein [Gammaproteobacteria bacterium]MCZ6853547.1 polyprenyl synthetase family protein [Gammaproteobacteria bacterium]
MPVNSAIAPTAVSKRAANIVELGPVYKLVEQDFVAVNGLIPKQLTSDVDLVEEIGHHIIESGGKRLRPLMVLLGAHCCGYPGDDHIRLAAIIEFLHTATLLHDDVVDRSDLRRGQPTANAIWGNAPSVLVGDFLYSRAFQLMVEMNDMDIMAILSDATNTIAEGEVMQLANVGNRDVNEEQYMEVIRCKTALLFQAATHTAAVLACHETETIAALRDFGLHFGLAYQLVDDWLDYAGDSEVMGKNVGADLAEGKLTLPLIYALARSSGANVARIEKALSRKSATCLDDIISIVRDSGALDYTRNVARAQTELAITCLDVLPDSDYRDAMKTLTHFCVARLS